MKGEDKVMRKKTGATSIQAVRDGQGGITSPARQHGHPNVPSAPESLIAFAEEFGRMIAGQLLADPNRRRGYSLPEGLVGLAFNSIMLLLGYCLMAWVRR